MTDKLPTESIRRLLALATNHMTDEDGWLAEEASAELSAILQRDKELEASLHSECKVRGKIDAAREMLLLENVRLRETLLDIALRGDSLPVDATPDEHDAAIIEMRDMANDALTPDTRYRAVDVAWLKEIEWMGAVQMISGRYFPMTCPACHQMSANGHAPDCWLAELIGEGE